MKIQPGPFMHELAVTRHILDIALRYAAEAEAVRITAVYLVVGDLSSIVDDSVQFYWDFISEKTIADGARLHFRRIPAEFLCTDCSHTYFQADGLTCPACGCVDVRIIAGEEFFLEAIDVTTPEEVMPDQRQPQGERQATTSEGVS